MSASRYPDVNPNPDFPALEEKILHFWKEKNVFQRSIDQCATGNGNDYVFYDGPPFANGLPHYGHLLTGYVKDAIARYQTMRGKRVERRFGWDCHGLPVEMGSEKELNVLGRAAIVEYGIGKFNEYCRNNIMRYVADWEYYVSRQGRWVDFQNDYKTMDTPFMESVIWAFSELYKKDLVFEAFRVMPYSWAAESPLSNFEIRMDNATREREDKAAFVKFKLLPAAGMPKKPTYLIAWTTTPWTLPSNLALAVGGALNYVYLIKNDELYIVSEAAEKMFEALGYERAKNKDVRPSSSLIQDGTQDEIAPPILGVDLTDDAVHYEPLFPYFAETKNAFRVIDGGDAVTVGEGTGVIHMAPGFGEVDQKVCAENGIEVMVPVDTKGRFTDEIFNLPDLSLKGLVVVPDTRLNAGDIHVSDEDRALHIDVKDVQKYGLANMRIVRWLKAHGKLVKDEPYKHNYPHCYRTDTPIIYRAMSSWYVAVTKFRDRAVELNQQINWIPGHVRDGQMGHMLATAPDWSISRNRFWGTPIPIWRAPSGKMIVPGSIAEIEQFSGKKVPDLHRPFIDEITFERDGETYTRVEDVFDCWFESGSMPYAQLHYPFENQEFFKANFPADFITEYVGQTRGWFNTLIMLSTALFDKPPFKNCICHGVVLDEETGLKYSKRLKNYKDPKEVMDGFGADALRWMMLASPVMRGADIGVDPEGKFIRDVVRLNIKPLWSAYNFFTLYANADGVEAKEISASANKLDRYILAKAKAAVSRVRESMDAYDTPGATDAITGFFDVLNNWYIRRSRARFWAEEMSADKQAAYNTLYTVITLLCRAASPLLPFTTEAIFRGLNAGESVHLERFPDVSAFGDEAELVADMEWIQAVCNAGLAIRSKMNIRTRQPLESMQIIGREMTDEELLSILLEEVNIKRYSLSGAEALSKYAVTKLAVNSAVLGKRLPAKMKEILPASKKGEWKRLPDGTIEVAGEKLLPGEFSIKLEPTAEHKDSAEPLATNDAIVVLDLTITPELEAEGRARDLVRMIQQARKDAGLNVADRIALSVDIPAEFKPALAAHKDYIAEQTLAVSIGEGSSSAEQQLKQELDGETFVIGISRAA